MLLKTKQVLELLSSDSFFKDNDVRFVGGTALSYLINHRLSEDLDFAMLQLKKTEILSLMDKYGAIKKEHPQIVIDSAINDGEDIDDSHLIFNLNGVKIDFFTPPFNNREIEMWNNYPHTHYEDTNVKIAAFETIFYMKTMAFWNRKKYRDLYDIYYVLTNEKEDYQCTPKKFIEDYMSYNITYTKENLLQKIESQKEFYERENDEGLSTLVKNAKPYEWYRNELEKMISKVYLDELYS